jgi:hypothetical protein
MFHKNGLSVLLKSLLALSAAAFTGCAQKPVPPVFSLYSYQRLAVIPFDNQSRDPDLPGALADEATEEVVNIGALPVIQYSQVAAFLKNSGATGASLLTDSDLRKRLGQKFQCDILLMGSADGYNEFLKDTAPEEVVVNSQTGESKWGFHTNRKVVVNGSLKLVDVASGSLLWSSKNQGYSWYNTWNPLSIPGNPGVPPMLKPFADLANLVSHRVIHEGDDEPPVIDENDPNVLIYPKSQYFSELRQKAVYQTTYSMVDDFRGHCNWVPR